MRLRRICRRGCRCEEANGPWSVVPPLSLRGAKRRVNLKAATDGKFRMNDTSRRLPRPRWGLAMTPLSRKSLRGGEADVGRKGAPPGAESSDRSGWAGTCLCTNEVQGKGLVPTRKSVLLAVGSCRNCLHGVRIATAPAGPRNDRCGRWSAPGLRLPLSLRGAKRRGNLLAVIHRTFLPNGTSRRLPRPRWDLAMTDVEGQIAAGLRPSQ